MEERNLDAPPAARDLPPRDGVFSAASLTAAVRRVDLPLIALWFALAAGLAVLTSQVVDWYVMTDELLYERLAISIATLGSPFPHIHGEVIGNVNQLYPLLLAPLFHDTLVPSALLDAHVLNAIVMSSACLPTFLLARAVTESRRLPYLLAALSVCIPWIPLSSMLMTEVVAYPAFVWAVLAVYRAAVSPRPQNDVVMVVALGVATLARTQFLVIFLVVPIAFYLHELAFTEAPSRLSRARVAGRKLVESHRPLTVAYAVLSAAVVVLLAVGRLSSALGTYSVTAEGDVLPSGMGRSLLEHLAPLGLGLGILPFVLGVSWLFATIVRPRARKQHAFAAIAIVTFAALLVEVTSYDLRFGQGRLHDRYLFYVVPLVLIAFAAALRAEPRLHWSLYISATLMAVAFSFVPVVRYEKFNVDSPVAVLNDALLDAGGSVDGARVFLGLATIVTLLLFLLAAAFLRRAQLTIVVLVFAVVALSSETALAFNRLLTVDGTSGRPITLDQGGVFDWIDRKVGPEAKVTMVPYPILYGNYWENVAYWWNVEFWNASVQRAVTYEQAFTGTPETFPATNLTFDRATGRANVSPSAYAVQGIAETRFRLAGAELGQDRGVALIAVDRPWRATWLAFDLYRDGWTVPKVVGKIRVFATPGQTQPEMRFLTISVRGPNDVPPRTFRIVSNASNWTAEAGEQPTSSQISVCVPARGFADVQVHAPHYSPIYGDPRSEASFVSYARSGGVLVTGIALADETGPC
ncbi:MAG: hypothetical protein M3P18_10175 [Actinomycetota bacterium]|nr:hypothetical protein [Actinomycetota bacterium]